MIDASDQKYQCLGKEEAILHYIKTCQFFTSVTCPLNTLQLPKPITRRRVMGYFLFDNVSFLSHHCLTVFGTRHFRVIWVFLFFSHYHSCSQSVVIFWVMCRWDGNFPSLYHSSHSSARKKRTRPLFCQQFLLSCGSQCKMPRWFWVHLWAWKDQLALRNEPAPPTSSLFSSLSILTFSSTNSSQTVTSPQPTY